MARTKKAVEEMNTEVKAAATNATDNVFEDNKTFTKVHVTWTFTEEVLGTASNNKEVYAEYIASKAADKTKSAEEVDALPVEEAMDKTMTVFPRDEEGNPIFFDYQIKGFFKDACGVLAKFAGSKSSELKAYKKRIDGLIFPGPRKIKINVNGEMGQCQRPLRAATAQGERIALAWSETVPAGSTCEFDVNMFGDYTEYLKEWFDYGAFRGTGQWRNSGKGRFVYTMTPVK